VGILLIYLGILQPKSVSFLSESRLIIKEIYAQCVSVLLGDRKVDAPPFEPSEQAMRDVDEACLTQSKYWKEVEATETKASAGEFIQILKASFRLKATLARSRKLSSHIG
jgi:hypothetical protein